MVGRGSNLHLRPTTQVSAAAGPGRLASSIRRSATGSAGRWSGVQEERHPLFGLDLGPRPCRTWLERPRSPSWATLPTARASVCPGSPASREPLQATEATHMCPRLRPRVLLGLGFPQPRLITVTICHLTRALGRTKELSPKSTSNCANERVRRGELGKSSKTMASGDKAPLPGTRREVASLKSQHPSIRQRPFCSHGGFPPLPPADTQAERRDVSVTRAHHAGIASD